MATAAYTGQTQQTTTGLVNAMAADASWCPAVQTCVVPSADSIQQLNATGSVAAWGSLVEIGATPLTANITVTLPAAAGNAGKTVTFKRLDVTAFTVTLAPFAGDTGEVTTPTVLDSQFGALTVEAVSSTKYEQVSNISTGTAVPPTTNALSSSGGAIISTVDSVVASLIPLAGTIQDNLGFDATGALVKAAPAATTNLLASSAAAITSTVDGVAATLTPAVGVIQDNLGFNAAGALVKAAPVSGGIMVTDGVQTDNRVQNFGTFAQTWNAMGGFTKNIVTGAEITNLSDTFTPSTAQVAFSPDAHNLLTNNGMGSNAALTVTPTLAQLEVNAGGLNRASFHISDGTVGAAAADPQLFLKTNAVYSGTAVAGQVLTLSAATGEAEFATAPPTVDTIQTAGTAGATAITAWDSVVLIPTLTGNITLVYPTPVGNIGKTIKIVQTGVPNAFTITHTPLVGTVTFTNAAGELASAAGAVTMEAVDTTSVLQVSNSVAEATSTLLTYGRVNASADLANITYAIASPGTKVPFSATVYSSGTTFSGTDSIVPSAAGRYRVSWFMMAGSGLFNGDGTFHVVQNGVSLGSVFVDMMEAAGVNQVSSFLDVNLVAGFAVELRYQPVVADAIAWGRGSYFDVTQLPTAVAPVVDTVAEYGESNLAVDFVPTTAFTSVTGVSVYLPSAGTYRLRYDVSSAITNADTTVHTLYARLLDSTLNVEVPQSLSTLGGFDNEQTALATNNFFTSGYETTYTVSGATTVALQGYVSSAPTGTYNFRAATSTTGGTKLSYQKIAGQLPSTGSTVDYAYARMTSNISVTNTAVDLAFNANLQGNIPNASGVFTLSAGKTYAIAGNFLGLGFDQVTTQGVIRFVDSTNTQVVGSPTAMLRPNSDTSLNGASPGFEFIFTPTVTDSYKFRADAAGVGRSYQIGQSESSVSLRQIGATANTVGTLPAVDQSSAGYFDIGNMRMQWGNHDDGNVDTTTVTLPAAFANANYTVTCTSNSGTAGSTSVEAKTTTTFDIDRASTTVNANTWGWMAIGAKP